MSLAYNRKLMSVIIVMAFASAALAQPPVASPPAATTPAPARPAPVKPAPDSPPPNDSDTAGDTEKLNSELQQPNVAEELPSDFDSLSKLKSELIDKFRAADQAGEDALANTVLAKLVRVEIAILDMAEDELTSENAELIDTYRQTPQTDCGMLAFRYFEAGEYGKSLQAYEQTLAIARRRPTLHPVELSDLIALRNVAAKLAGASTADQKAYQLAKQQMVANKEKLAAAGENAGSAQAAITELRHSYDEIIRIAGGTPSLATEIASSAQRHKNFADFKTRESWFHEALAMLESTVGTDNERYATVLFNLGIAYRDQQRWADAQAAFTRCSRIEDRIGTAAKSKLMTLDELAGIATKLDQTELLNDIVGRYRSIEYRSSLGLEALTPLLPAGTFAAVTMDPAAIMRNESLKQFPREMATSFLMDVTGVDPNQVQSAVGFICLPIAPNMVNAGILLKPIAGANLDVQLPGVFREVISNRTTYKKRSDEEGVCFATLPSGVLVAGTENAVQQVLGRFEQIAQDSATENSVAEKPTSNAEVVSADLLASHGRGELFFTWDTSKVQSILAEVLSAAPGLPEELEPLKSLATRVASMNVTLSLAKAPLFQVRIRPSKESSAAEIHSIVQPAFLFGLNELKAEIDRSVATSSAGSGATEATNAYVLRMLQDIYNSAGPTIQADEVVATLESFQSVYPALLLPAIEGARNAAAQTSDSNNLKQIALAMHNFNDTYSHLPLRGGKSPTTAHGLSWRVHILPFLGELELYEQFHLDEAWDSEHNRSLVERMPSVYAGTRPEIPPGRTNLLTIDSPDSVITNDTSVRLVDITDGMSNTVMLVEADADRAVIWTQPEDLAFDAEDPMAGLGNARGSGFHVALSDGAVVLLPSDLPPQTMAALVTRAGGEVVELP
ncbi:MAG: DUF1559 domain-containing protein [Pirellulaceae bacterium]|nr:DUF1559 domain-containing protein [Pirellulaceae bacterium]